MNSIEPATRASRERVAQEVGSLSPPKDVSASAFLAAALAPTDQSRERLLSFMVHEIRNPLASTLWAVEMLARGSLGDPRSDRLAQLAARSIRRLRALIEDSFALERVPSSATPGRTDLRAAIERALAPHDLEPAGIVATVDAAEGVVVDADPVLVDKLLLTCLRRLVHSGPPGSLTIHLRREDTTAELTIFRAGSRVMDVDPPLLTPGGSDTAGTTFSLLVARALAQVLNVALCVGETPDGVTVRLVFLVPDGR